MTRQTSIPALFALLGFCLPCLSAGADEIMGVSLAGVSSENGANQAAVNTINGSGLTVASPIQNSTHSNGFPNGGGSGFFWHTAVGPAASDTFITYDLGAMYDLNSAYIWNFNAVFSGGPETNRGFQQFDISAGATPDGLATVISDATLNQAGGTTAEPSQTVDLSGVSGVRFIRFDVDTNYGGGVTGLSEVRFDGTFVGPGLIDIDLTRPGDTIVGSSTNTPAAQTPLEAIDNLPDTKYLNFDKLNTGFEVAPFRGIGIVQGLTFTSGGDAPERDPTTFVLDGSHDGGQTWIEIAAGTVPDFTARGQKLSATVDNDTRYGEYRITFPTVRDAGAANSMQIAEVEFLANEATILGDVTSPSDAVTGFNAAGSGADFPGGEPPSAAIDDDTGTKYLNFGTTGSGGGSGTGGVTGLDVTPGPGPTVVQGLSLTSANDASERDPASFNLLGSNDGSVFTLIASGNVPAFPDRFTTNVFTFDNNTSYETYRVEFPDVANPGGTNSMQIAEIQLLGSVIPEPSALVLALLGATVLGTLRSSKRRSS